MICKECGKDLPEEKFAIVKGSVTYTRKSDGVTVTYTHAARRKKCNKCTRQKYQVGMDAKYSKTYNEKKRNRLVAY